MNQPTFKIEEFNSRPEEQEEQELPEVDVQKAVVEELAAEKVELQVQADMLSNTLDEYKTKISELNEQIAGLKEELRGKEEIFEKTKAAFEESERNLAAARKSLADRDEEFFDSQSRNPNMLALLDRDVDIPDRFPGETRDHVLEVLKSARDVAEEEGRIRLAQVLEGVLVSNEPNGTLSRKRDELRKLFAENLNVVTGQVMEKLNELNISYKHGEEYLTAEEIQKRTY